MQKNYVLQVLVVTLGFGVLLGLIAVVDAPRDWSQEPTTVPSTSGNPVNSAPVPGQITPSSVMSPRVVDFNDRADFPSDDSSNEIRTLPWQNCDHSTHKKACEDNGRPVKTGKIHC